MPPIQAVIFDMDGLLIDTERLAGQATQKACLEVLGTELPDEIIIDMIGMNEAGSIGYITRFLNREIPQTALSEAFHAHYSHLLKDGITPKPGCFELLDHLERIGLPKAVATSTKTKLAFDKLGRAGINPSRFVEIVGGDQVVDGKPAPDIYLLAAQRLNTEPEFCLALEDSLNGIKAANSAGIDVICIPDIKQPNQEMKDLSLGIVGSLSDVKDYLLSQ